MCKQLNLAVVSVAVGAVVFCTVPVEVLGQAPENAQIERGLELFLHEWKPNDAQAGGDGLGPLHNDVSCLKCHFLRSPGGAGTLENNIQLLSAIPKLNDDVDAPDRARDLLAKLHPSFAIGEGDDRLVRRSIVLHRHDLNPNYDSFRATLLGRPPGNLPVLEEGTVESHLRVLVNSEGVAWLISERNSPALFGAGLIDQLADDVFLQTAARQGKDGIKGRVPRTENGSIGRFGWRGQSSSLESFVATAFAVELGLSNHQVLQEPSPLAANIGQVPAVVPAHDVAQADIADVTTFLQNLPAPRLESGGDRGVLNRAERGRRSFASIGCAACHQRYVGPIREIFSDLLLHDMGEGLADPVPGPSGIPQPVAAASVATQPATQPAAATPQRGGYAGPPVGVLQPIDPIQFRLWRTPPLWGVGDSAPYLHDGRAGTLRRAIILHGGEGELSRNRFLGLNEEAQSDVIMFLSRLRAPQLIRDFGN